MLPIKEYIKNPKMTVVVLVKHYGQWLPDSLYLKIIFRMQMGYRLNLRHPRSFSEKLQWLKLYNQRPEYTMMVDKYAVKDYVASIIGNEYVIPTLGVWNKPKDIEWDKLPNQFVLKTTNGGNSEGVVICKDKNSLDKQAVIKQLNRSFVGSIYHSLREWPYKNMPHRIIAEQYIEPEPGTNDLPDYKFFCFDGEVKAMFIATERQKKGEDVKFDFFDAEFNHLPFRQGHDQAKVPPAKPRHFEEMKQLACLLSKGIPQVRVDFFEVGDKIFFGELTFFHFSGSMPFEPREWDYKFGSWITLPKEKCIEKQK